MTTEKDLEKLLTNKLQSIGVWVAKYTNPFKVGYPDRICILPSGRAFWVEVKSPGAKLRPLQEIRAKELRSFGCEVFVVDSEQKIEEVLDFARKNKSRCKQDVNNI